MGRTLKENVGQYEFVSFSEESFIDEESQKTIVYYEFWGRPILSNGTKGKPEKYGVDKSLVPMMKSFNDGDIVNVEIGGFCPKVKVSAIQTSLEIDYDGV